MCVCVGYVHVVQNYREKKSYFSVKLLSVQCREREAVQKMPVPSRQGSQTLSVCGAPVISSAARQCAFSNANRKTAGEKKIYDNNYNFHFYTMKGDFLSLQYSFIVF